MNDDSGSKPTRIFPELEDDDDTATVAPHFSHMRLDTAESLPRVRYRLSATMGVDGDVEEALLYVLEQDADGSPLTTAQVPPAERNHCGRSTTCPHDAILPNTSLTVQVPCSAACCEP